MADKQVPSPGDARNPARFAKLAARAAKKGTPIPIHSTFMSLLEMLRERGSDFSTLEELDSYSHSSKFLDTSIISAYNEAFNFPKEYFLKKAEPGDRTCHWDPKHLFFYRDALLGGALGFLYIHSSPLS